MISGALTKPELFKQWLLGPPGDSFGVAWSIGGPNR